MTNETPFKVIQFITYSSIYFSILFSKHYYLFIHLSGSVIWFCRGNVTHVACLEQDQPCGAYLSPGLQLVFLFLVWLL